MATVILSFFFFIIQSAQELNFFSTFTPKLMQSSSNQKTVQLLLQSRSSPMYTFASVYKLELI